MRSDLERNFVKTESWFLAIRRLAEGKSVNVKLIVYTRALMDKLGYYTTITMERGDWVEKLGILEIMKMSKIQIYYIITKNNNIILTIVRNKVQSL